jgi:hypothetical protein
LGIFTFETDGNQALGFDTGLDSRAFAQAKCAQYLTEPGLIVFPDGRFESWRAAGVIEYGGGPNKKASMVIHGPPLPGERLDLLLNAGETDALWAVFFWIQARLAIGDQKIPVQPFAALIAVEDQADSYPAGSVFFAPEQLVKRCVLAEAHDHAGTGSDRICGGEWYVHPDLEGKDASAFTAAAMLYRIFSGSPPFPAMDENLLHEDIREGNFLPAHLAAPGLNRELADMIQAAFGPGAHQFLHQLFEILNNAGAGSPGCAHLETAPFIRALSEEELKKAVEDRELFLKKKKITVKTRRFVIKNTALILGIGAVLLIGLLSARSIIKSRAELPTTRGMTSLEVIQSYYGAIGSLDHQMMDACTVKGAGKDDINMVSNFFVISKMREAYEQNRESQFLSAQEWKDSGAGPAASQVFGITDLEIEKISGSEDGEESHFNSSFIIWIPAAGETPEEDADTMPQGYSYTDDLSLIRYKGDWRISKIERTLQ